MALEKALLLILPSYITVSVLKYVPKSAFVFFIVLLCVSLKFVYARYGSFWKVVTLYLLILTLVVFITGTWTIYKIDGLRVFPDTGLYVHMTKLKVLSQEFLFRGYKSFVTAAVFTAFQSDWSKINIVFIVLFIAFTILFIFMVITYFNDFDEKLLASCLFILLFLNQRMMSLWMSTALSEIPAMVTTLLVITVFGFSYVYRERLAKRKWATWAVVGLVAVTAFLFSGSRDTNNYFLPFLILFYFFVFKRWSVRVTLIVVIACIFFAFKSGFEKSPRWQCPLGNVVTKRIIPDERLRRLFQETYNLPEDEIVTPCSGLWIYDDHPNLKYIYSRREKRDDWVTVYGYRSYTRFLLTSPRYVLEEWIRSWHTVYNTSSWSYADSRVKEKPLNRFVFHFLGEIPVVAGGVLLVFGLIFFKKNPLVLFCLSHACVVGIITYHGDAMEIHRHCQQAAMTLRISLLLFILQTFSTIKSRGKT